ncbi:glycosyltransferase family A protein [Aquincola sp. MAHUQ-54]|uniref:Glycosyltransferase family A protein n=1 Tax=Aquincola agrisoli TaxID=3119538 RepID=A0AAW9QKM5_9BURK
MKQTVQYAVVTPVRDEVRHIGRTIDSMAAQTIRPARWVIVDDGSTDGTSALLDHRCATLPWITVLHRHDRGFRAAGGGVMQAFHAGLALLADTPWEFLVKLDGDLSFAPGYFEACLEAFRQDATLGIGGGTVHQLEDGALYVDSAGDPPFHVRGATKIYRRACWARISPLIEAPGWDTFDEVQANFRGWTTRTFPDLAVVQLKPTGAAAGRWRDAFKNGRANYVSGYHPAFMLAKCVRRAFRRPMLVQAAGLLSGYCSGYLKQVPTAPDPDAIRWLRGQQLRRLTLRSSIYG